MYDIDPSMYEGAARYFFEGLLPVRQFAYRASKHYQGTHYECGLLSARPPARRTAQVAVLR